MQRNDFVNSEFEALKENTLLQIPELNGRELRMFEFKAAREALRINVGELPKGVYTITLGNAAPFFIANSCKEIP